MSQGFLINWRHTVNADRRLSRGAKHLAHALASYMSGRRGYCFPSVERLTGDLNCCEQSIRRWRKELQRAGLVFVEFGGGHKSGFGPSGRGWANTYYAVLDGVDAGGRIRAPYPVTDDPAWLCGFRFDSLGASASRVPIAAESAPARNESSAVRPRSSASGSMCP